MPITCRQWDRIKLSQLTRLARDLPRAANHQLCNPNYLPFLQKTFAETDGGIVVQPALDIDSIEAQSQEVKSLQLNESCMASDTQAVAVASGYGSTSENAVKKL